MKSKQLMAALLATSFVMLLVGTAVAGKHRQADGRSLRPLDSEATRASARVDYFEALLREPLVERSLELDFDADQFVGFSLVENNRATALLDFEVDPLTGSLRPVDLLESQNVMLGRDLNLLPLWLATKDHQAVSGLDPLSARSTEVPHDDVTILIDGGDRVVVFLWHQDDLVGAFYAQQISTRTEQQLDQREDSLPSAGNRTPARSPGATNRDFNSTSKDRSADFAQDRDILLNAGDNGGGRTPPAEGDCVISIDVNGPRVEWQFWGGAPCMEFRIVWDGR